MPRFCSLVCSLLLHSCWSGEARAEFSESAEEEQDSEQWRFGFEALTQADISTPVEMSDFYVPNNSACVP